MNPADRKVTTNIVICCDGTNNQFGHENTNVVRTVQVLHRDPDTQLVHYDPGVGTLPEPGMLRITRVYSTKIGTWLDLAMGTGLPSKVQAAYSYLMDFVEPGDQVYLFGFSRGAYTAAGTCWRDFCMLWGLCRAGSHNLAPYAMRLFEQV